jgi:hypothetical protein
MPLNWSARRLIPGLAFLFGSLACSQTTSLSLASGTGVPGGSVTLNLSLSAVTGSQPASLEWGVSYPTANVTGISFAAERP